ncbi:MAG: toll/interleukin-1 receptor domain-containing protein [Nitrospira sp.]|nr:toll/interleukin-1 receptor domain-containing protein [Nitrospira sp.]
MAAWNLVLQIQGPNSSSPPHPRCQQFSIPGLPRPCRILFYACDTHSAAQTRAAYDQVEATLKARQGVSVKDCDGPGLWDCMTWDESSCLQVLVPVIGAPISKAVETDLVDWQTKAGSLSVIVPALLPGISHDAAFARNPKAVSRLNSASWQGNPARLAAIIAQRALQLEKPGLFISYRRSEAGALVDQLYDQLAHRGFRVFLDRFSGTPGRYFPSELAEEMADKATLLVIETPNILQSKWTLWEIGFAHRYRLGLVSLQMPGAPSLSRIPSPGRLVMVPDAKGMLKPKDLARALTFIDREQVVASLRRRAFYEGLVTGAASLAGGTANDIGGGVLELCNSAGHASAVVLPSGRPGQLADVRSLALAHSGQLPRLLLGQHRHLPPSAQADLSWLAGQTSTELLGRYSGYRRVQALC